MTVNVILKLLNTYNDVSDRIEMTKVKLNVKGNSQFWSVSHCI